MCELYFIYCFYQLQKLDCSSLILLYGMGGNEYDLMLLVSCIVLNVMLLGGRGWFLEEGINCWFCCFDVVIYDQVDIWVEVEVFVVFIDDVVQVYGLDWMWFGVLGYFNGVNLIGVILQFYLQVISCVVLLCGIQVLEELLLLFEGVLLGYCVLMLNGVRDMFGCMVFVLENVLWQGGVDFESQILFVGYELLFEDVMWVQVWLV